MEEGESGCAAASCMRQHNAPLKTCPTVVLGGLHAIAEENIAAGIRALTEGEDTLITVWGKNKNV